MSRMPEAELLRELDRPNAWTLFIDGIPHSHVDLDDPGYLEFEYMRRLGHLLDAMAPGPLRVLHLGAGALTLARYLAATRPGSDQLAVDNDPALIEMVRERLPLPPSRKARIRVRIGDASTEVMRMRPAWFDAVIVDVFTQGRTPASLTSAEFMTAAARTLRESGILAINVSDGPPLSHARGQVATACSVFPHACLIADASVLRGRRFGNLVLAASRQPFELTQLTRRAAADPMPGRVLAQDELTAFAGGARPSTADTAQPSPTPPPEVFTS
jgi:spermidine synthase